MVEIRKNMAKKWKSTLAKAISSSNGIDSQIKSKALNRAAEEELLQLFDLGNNS